MCVLAFRHYKSLSTLAMTVSHFKDSREMLSPTDLINPNAVCRNAMATLGLLQHFDLEFIPLQANPFTV